MHLRMHMINNFKKDRSVILFIYLQKNTMHLHSCVYTGTNSSEIHDNSIVHYLTDYLTFPIHSKCSLILSGTEFKNYLKCNVISLM